MKTFLMSCLISGVSVVILIFPGCHHQENDKTTLPFIKTHVTTIHPAFKNISENIQLNGITVFQKKNSVRSNVTGYILSMKYKPGDVIEAGKIFCLIGTKEQIALKDLASADTSLAKFRQPLAVVSGGSGIITTVTNMEGDYVSEGDVLATINETNSLIIQVNVPYEYNAFVFNGKPCEIILPGNKIINASINGALPTVEAASQAQEFFIRLPGNPLPENLNVTVRVTVKQGNNLISVPSAAIQTDEMQKDFWLMKISDDSVAIKVPVKTGLQNDSLTEITSGNIKITDLIIMKGAYGLNDSTLVISDYK